MRTDFLQASYRSLDLLLGVTALGFGVVFLLSIPMLQTISGGAEKPTYIHLIANSSAAPVLEDRRVHCGDHSNETPERRWVYERVERALFPSGAPHPLNLSILDNYAIADPERFWTVSSGQPCGEVFMFDAETLFAVDRRTGKVSDGVWVTFAFGGPEPYWHRDEHGWTKVPRAAWAEERARRRE